MLSHSSSIGELGSCPGNLYVGGSAPYDLQVRGWGSGLTNFWRLDEAQGSAVDFADQKGSLPGVLVGTATSSAGPFLGEGALTLTAGNYFNIPGTWNQGNGMVEFWCNIPSNPATGSNKALLFGNVETSTKWGKHLYLNSSNALVLTSQSPAAQNSIVTFSNFVIGRWNHVAIFFTTGSLTLYVNGVAGSLAAPLASRVDIAAGSTYLGGCPSGLGFVDCPGTYSHLATYSNSPTLQTYLPYQHYLAGSEAFPTTRARATRFLAQVLRDSAGRKARVTKMSVQVLRSSAFGSLYSVSGSGGFSLHAGTSYRRLATASASGGILISRSSAAVAAHTYSVAASGGMTLSPDSAETGNFLAFAAGSIALDSSSSAPAEYSVSGSGGLILGGAGNGSRAGFGVATGGVTFHGTATARREVHGAGEGGIGLHGVGTSVALYEIHCSATSSISLSSASHVVPPGDFLAECFGHFGLHATASERRATRAVASGSFYISMNSYRRISPARVSNEPGLLSFSATATAEVRGGRVGVCQTSFLMEGDCETLRIYRPLSRSSFRVAVTSSEVRLADSRAASSVALSHAPKAGRAISVSAITSMSLVSADDPATFRYHLAGQGGLVFHHIADLGIGYTPCVSGITFKDVAFATSKLPWRFRPLTLPAGGGLPHS